jgi:hypothetical protein
MSNIQCLRRHKDVHQVSITLVLREAVILNFLRDIIKIIKTSMAAMRNTHTYNALVRKCQEIKTASEAQAKKKRDSS